MRVHVDVEKCTGHARCWSLAPEVYELDDLGYNVTERPVHVHDLQATILHCLGLDHEKLTFRYAGRDFRLTDVYGKVVRDILA